jgi:hypothetical protein
VDSAIFAVLVRSNAIFISSMVRYIGHVDPATENACMDDFFLKRAHELVLGGVEVLVNPFLRWSSRYVYRLLASAGYSSSLAVFDLSSKYLLLHIWYLAGE